MQEKLEGIKTRYEELSGRLADPALIGDVPKYTDTLKKHAALEEIVQEYETYRGLLAQEKELSGLIAGGDEELQQIAREELPKVQSALEASEAALKAMLVPRDPRDERNVIMEVRAGTGGDEAALFGADLVRMYMRYAERRGYKTEMLSTSLTDIGGVKEVVMSISGRGAFSRLKYESGVHRVQRVPETESQGRVHTSAATVAVLPEAEDVEVEIDPGDLRVDVYRSGGHGGQSVNTTDSAVRITHLPSGLVVTCQDEKSQLKNKEKAMRVLKSRLLDLMRSQQDSELAAQRKSQVGSGDRSERIRTYNFPQGRVTDHRIGLTLYRLEAFMLGDLDGMIDALAVQERANALKNE
ncbi:MAG: peptide chain release factor 1 [Christensenellales bacterium]|nr:peptide chain release factor 1 [Clostridiales bacterium]